MGRKLSAKGHLALEPIHVAEQRVNPRRPKHPYDSEQRDEDYYKGRPPHKPQAEHEPLGRKAQDYSFVPNASIDKRLHLLKQVYRCINNSIYDSYYQQAPY